MVLRILALPLLFFFFLPSWRPTPGPLCTPGRHCATAPQQPSALWARVPQRPSAASGAQAVASPHLTLAVEVQTLGHLMLSCMSALSL